MSAVILLAEVDLEDLETAAALLGPAGIFQAKNRATAEAFAKRLRAALDAGHRVAIVGRGAKNMAPADRWRLPLESVPQPWRGQARRALESVVGIAPPDRVDYLM